MSAFAFDPSSFSNATNQSRNAETMALDVRKKRKLAQDDEALDAASKVAMIMMPAEMQLSRATESVNSARLLVNITRSNLIQCNTNHMMITGFMARIASDNNNPALQAVVEDHALCAQQCRDEFQQRVRVAEDNLTAAEERLAVKEVEYAALRGKLALDVNELLSDDDGDVDGVDDDAFIVQDGASD